MDFIAHARKTLTIEQNGIAAISQQLDDTFNAAIQALLDTIERNGKIVIAGVGKNWHIGNKIAATLNSTGSPAAVMHPIEAMHGDFGLLGDSDLLIAMSYSGASEEITALLPPVKRRNIPIIALTAEADSPLALHSDLVLNITVPEEACPFNMAPTASTTATLALGDALSMVLLQARGFQLKDYAQRHPGGAIGRTLLLSVQDIMRTQENFAVILTGQPIREAILAMTAAKSGSVAILDSRQKLLGILTDGDLRRHLIETPDLLEKSVDTIMTPSPITLTPNMLAVDALKLYESHNIDDLIVVDDQGIALGSVDIQDMPKLKII
ncbi:MAG: KpsF/GutQ family sugar-phosphate isomerase [Kiritimatiellaceae bacterium]|nr:KpsF/GutQ family sugar-phosphate isomerase [Kiritimatiellaceae bacterium]